MGEQMDVAQKASYRYERVDETRYKDLCYISMSAFGFDPGVEFYRAKNKTAAFGEPHLGFLAYSESGEPAAFYGVYACQVEFNGNVHKAVQSGDTMTHRNHTGKGLFTILAKMTYALASEYGVEFVFGAPNSNSLPGFVKKLAWLCPEKMNDYRIAVPTLPFSKLAKKARLFNLLYRPVAEIAFKKRKSNAFFRNSVLHDGWLGVHRSEEYYRYKSFSGCHLLNIGGVNAWIKLDGSLILGDIDMDNDPDMDKFLSSLKRFCFWMGISEIAFITSPGTKFDSRFSAICKPKEGLPVGYAAFNTSLPMEKFKMVFGDMDTF